MWFGQTIMFTPSKAHPKHLSLHPLSRWLVHSLIPRCIHQVQKQELAWQTGMQLSSQNKYRTICYQSAFPPQTLLTRALLFYPHRIPCRRTHKDRKKPTRRAVPLCNPDIIFPHPELLTYCSARRKEQQWRRIWTRENLAWERKESY